MAKNYEDKTKKTEKAPNLSGKVTFSEFKLMVLRHFENEHYFPYDETDEINYNIQLIGSGLIQAPAKPPKKPKRK